MRGDFFQRVGPANEGDFSNGPAGTREMSFKMPGPGYKKSKTENIARQSGPINLLVIIIIIITEYISQSASSLLFS